MLYISYIIYHRFSVAIKNVYLSISFTYHIFIIVCLLLGGGGGGGGGFTMAVCA